MSELKTAQDIAVELGVTRESIYGAAKRGGMVKGFEIVKVGSLYAAIKASTVRRQLPTKPVLTGTRQCVVCEARLTPRRTVRINGHEHCVPCNRRAFVDFCVATRKALGVQ